MRARGRSDPRKEKECTTVITLINLSSQYPTDLMKLHLPPCAYSELEELGRKVAAHLHHSKRSVLRRPMNRKNLSFLSPPVNS